MIVLETLGRRWYAFAFVVAFFWAASAAGSWRRALRFLAIAAALSLAAELSSTRNGFPYGRYSYIAHTRGDELSLWNVPLFVPVSFGTMVWAGRSLAISGIRAASPAVRILGGALMAGIVDLAIDPMTLRGSEWFLGDLYAYQAGGYFGVPWSNFGGWLLVSAAILALDEAAARPRPFAALPELDEAARGTTLAFGILGFFVVVALATASWAVAGQATGISAALGALIFTRRHRTAPPRPTG